MQTSAESARKTCNELLAFFTKKISERSNNEVFSAVQQKAPNNTSLQTTNSAGLYANKYRASVFTSDATGHASSSNSYIACQEANIAAADHHL